MTLYKVSPPRESLLFKPTVFYRTADFKSSSLRSKPGYIQDTLLYAGDESEISLHLLPSIYRRPPVDKTLTSCECLSRAFGTPPGSRKEFFTRMFGQ